MPLEALLLLIKFAEFGEKCRDFVVKLGPFVLSALDAAPQHVHTGFSDARSCFRELFDEATMDQFKLEPTPYPAPATPKSMKCPNCGGNIYDGRHEFGYFEQSGPNRATATVTCPKGA